MRILGIDTTTKYLSLGIFDGSKTYEYNLDLGIRHSTLLVPTIKRVLDAVGLDLKKIDYFACGLGPGSFTGMRVGLATIKGLSWACKKPIVGISTLDILAKNVKSTDKQIVAAIDAKRKLIYCGIFKNNGRFKRLKTYMLLGEDELLKVIESESIILGDAILLYKEDIFKKIKGVSFLENDCWYPKGHNIIELALERVKEGKASNALNVNPIYLYPKECQIKR